MQKGPQAHPREAVAAAVAPKRGPLPANAVPPGPRGQQPGKGGAINMQENVAQIMGVLETAVKFIGLK